MRTPSRGVTLASLATLSTQACTLATWRVGVPRVPSVVGMLTHDALSLRDAEWSSSPSDTLTLRATSALAWSATFSASAVVTAGTVSTYSSVAVVDDRSRAAAATTSWKLSGETVLPVTAGTTTNDCLSDASFTPAARPALPTWPTRSATSASVAAVSVRTTASTSREETSDLA